MIKLTLKERFAFRFIFNERRVYQRWYGRFLVFGIDYGRLRRVVARVGNWLEWCREWRTEGAELEGRAGSALEQGDLASAIAWFHEAVACYHIGQHIFFIDPEQKESTQEMARQCYVRAIALYPPQERPVRIEIPFEGTVLPGYLHCTPEPSRPLVIYVNGMDNIKEAENHFFGRRLNRWLSLIPVPLIGGYPGFRHKLWMADRQSGFWQGVYEWESADAVEAYRRSFVLRLMNRRAEPESISYTVMEKTGLADFVDRCARGPVPSPGKGGSVAGAEEVAHRRSPGGAR